MKVIGWHLQRLIAEGETDLVGGTIEQIRRYRDRSRLLILLGSKRGKVYMHLGVRGEASCFFWADDPGQRQIWASAARTESFNRLRDAHLIALGIPSNDRVVRFEFAKESEGGPLRFSLVAAWLGSRSNLWLVDPSDETISEVLHTDENPRTTSRSARETLELPQPKSLAAWQGLTPGEYLARRERHADLAFGDFLQRHFWGIDASLARAVVESHEMRGAGSYQSEFEALKHTAQLMTRPDTQLVLREASQRTEIATAAEDGSSLSSLLAQLDRMDSEGQARSARWKRVSDTVAVALRKLDRRLQSIDRSLSEGPRVEEYRRHADLLSGNRDRLTRGLSRISVSAFDGAPDVTITLNPARSPQQNIDDYYRKSRKMSDTLASAQAERPRVALEHARLKDLADRLSQEETSEEAVQAAELMLGLSAVIAPRTKQVVRRLPYREFKLGQHVLWVGRSSRDNDELTMKHARPEDLFFHVHGAPGSHVVLKRESRTQEFDKATLLAAAQVAAFFSKAKHAGLVPVVYAEARFVRKPRKAPAGTVMMEREKSLMVRPLPPPGYHEKPPST